MLAWFVCRSYAAVLPQHPPRVGLRPIQNLVKIAAGMQGGEVANRQTTPRIEDGIYHRDGRYVGVTHDTKAENVNAVICHGCQFRSYRRFYTLTVVCDDSLHGGTVVRGSVLVVIPVVE